MSKGLGTKWSVQEMLLLYKLKTANKSYPEIADVLSQTEGKRPYSANCCKKKWHDTNWEHIIEEVDAQQDKLQQLDDKESEKQRIIESTIANQERLIKRDQARTDLIVEALQSAVYRLPAPKPVDISYDPPQQKKYTAEHVGLVLSDLHIGAAYSLEETGGLSEFNLDIFYKRLSNLKKSVSRIIERHRLMYDLPELHIFCLGDIVAGMENAGQWSMSYINLDIYDQMLEGARALRDFVATLSRAFPKVTFYGIYGNHGRVGKRGDSKVSTNWDRICYEFLKMSLIEYKNIHWEIPTAWFLQKKIQGHQFFLSHGDGIRGSMGIPHYGVERAEKNIAGLMPNRPDYFLIGHFHSSAEMQTNSSKIIMNGSFMGGDIYSLRDLRRCERAEQKIFGIHQKHGVTWTYNIHLDSEE